MKVALAIFLRRLCDIAFMSQKTHLATYKSRMVVWMRCRCDIAVCTVFDLLATYVRYRNGVAGKSQRHRCDPIATQTESPRMLACHAEEIYRVFFLIVVVFDSASCLYFSPDFIHRPLIFFVRLCAIDRGIDHNFIISRSRVISQCVNGLILKKMILNGFWWNFRFFEFSNKT